MRVTPNCDPLNSFYINQAPGVQTQPEIAFGGGVYLTMWSDAEDYFHAYGCRVTPAGTVLDPAGIRLGPDDTLRQTDPSAAYNGTSFFVIWGSTYRPRIMGRFVGTDGSLGDTLNLAVSGEDVCETRLAWSGTNYLAAWIDGSYTLNGLIVSTAGTPVGSPFTIATLVDQYSLSLCFDGTQYCVNYVQKTGSFNHVYGRKYTTAGVPVAGPYLISSGSNFEFYCEVVPGANNHYLTAWAGIYASSYDIHGNLDVPIVGIEERPASGRQKTPGATIVAGPLPRTGTRIYNGLGRLIREPNPGPGVYFYLKGGGSVGKIVKVR